MAWRKADADLFTHMLMLTEICLMIMFSNFSVHKDCEGAKSKAANISWTLRYRGNDQCRSVMHVYSKHVWDEFYFLQL